VIILRFHSILFTQLLAIGLIMKKINFRTSLLLTTSLLLFSACDQSSDVKSDGSSDDIMSSYSPSQMEMPPATLSGSFLSGQFAQDRSDWESASTYFAKILDSAPAESDIQRRLMALEMGSGHYDQAIAMAEKISKSGTKDKALANLLLSLSTFKAGKFNESLKTISGYQTDALGVAILPLIKTWAEAGQGTTDITQLKDSPSLVYQAVLVAAYTQNKEALAQLAKSYDFTKTPTPVSRLEDIALIFAHYGETEEAKSIYTALKSGVPDRANDYDAIIKQIDSNTLPPLPKQLSSPQVGLSDAIFDMAQILSHGYQDSARLFAHMSLYLNADNPASYELLAQIASDNKLYSEATAYLSRIDTTGSPDKKTQIERQIAQLQVLAGHPEEAVRILKELVEGQKNIDAQIQIGDIYRSQDDFKNALKAYNEAYSLLGNNITAKYWDLSFARGMTNERLKNWDQAEKDLQTALLFEPDQPYVLNYLGYSWADQGINLDKAAEMIEKAVRLKPDDGAIVDSLGWIYFRMGQYDKAVATLEKAIQLAPTEPELNDHLGDAYWNVGRKSEARFQWKRAASFTTDNALIAKIQMKIDNGLPEIAAQKPKTEKIVENK
jgi:tetratricopeptide (TPR) repeat protein